MLRKSNQPANSGSSSMLIFASREDCLLMGKIGGLNYIACDPFLAVTNSVSGEILAHQGMTLNLSSHSFLQLKQTVEFVCKGEDTQ